MLSVLTKPGEEGEPAVAHPPLVQRHLELGFAGEAHLSGGGGLNEGRQVLSLRGRESYLVQVALVLPFEEPDAPGERDEDATGLWAGDLTLTPIYVEPHTLVNVPQRLLEADRILAAGTGRVLYSFIGEVLNSFVDPALPGGVLPEAREFEPTVPVEMPVDDARGIEVVHRSGEPACVRDPELPSAPQVRGALQRPVLPAFCELGDLPRRPWIFAHFEVLRFRIVPVTQRVSSRRSPAHDHLPEDATLRCAIYPRCKGLARVGRDVLHAWLS